jgi:hypothetical protein
MMSRLALAGFSTAPSRTLHARVARGYARREQAGGLAHGLVGKYPKMMLLQMA